MKISYTLNDAPVALAGLTAAAEQAMADAVLGGLLRKLGDIRDPATGEPPRITITPGDDGLSVAIHGSQAVVEEANRRLSDG